MKIRNLLFVLPNLFTVSSIFCGFYAVVLCASDSGAASFYQAALCILFAGLFDGVDGRVARLTKTQSQFGMELDSLADVMSFGVAPALLVYKWALEPLGFLGALIAFCFAACGALRLARFNVLAQRAGHSGPSRFFVGLPIPLAAAVLVSVVIGHHGLHAGEPLPPNAIAPIAGMVIVLSLLMVSTVRYRTFKDLRLSRRSALTACAVLLLGVAVAVRLHPSLILAAYFAMYLIAGLFESGLLLRSHMVERRARHQALAAELDEEDDAEVDAEDGASLDEPDSAVEKRR